MKFKYVRFRGRDNKGNFVVIVRPVIPITIKYKTNEIKTYGLVDSGADDCIFPTEIASELGIIIGRGERKTVGGVIDGVTKPYYVHDNITINVGGWDYKTKIGFMKDLSRSMGVGILGQEGFFDKFVIKFDRKKEIVDIKEKR